MDKIFENKIQIVTLPDIPGRFEKKKKDDISNGEILGFLGNTILFWGKTIDGKHNVLYRIQTIVNNSLHSVLFVFGALGIIFLFWEFFILYRQGIAIWQSVFQKDLRMFIFWLSVFFDCYLYTRLAREIDSIEYIPKKIPIGDLDTPWQEVLKKKNVKKIDISKIYSIDAQKIVINSYMFADQQNHGKIGPIHMLVALLGNSDIVQVFARLGMNFQALKERISHALSAYLTPTGKELSFTEDFYQVLYNAYFEAYQLNDKKVEPTELLVSLVKQSQQISEIFYDLEIDTDKVVNVTQWIRFQKSFLKNFQRMRSKASLRPHSSMDRAMTAVATPFLDQFSVDLTAMARDGYLEACVGRKKEIEEIFRIIKGGSRTSVILVGPPGVGKKTIANGIAHLMVAEEVPSILSDKRLVSLDLARLASGANASEASQRLLVIVSEILRAKNIVLFIDNVSKSVGISQGSAGSLDLAEVLAQALRKKQIIAITTALPQEYTHFIENKSGLDQVLEKVIIQEISGNEAIQVLEVKSLAIESQYQIFFSYNAIEKVVQLSNRFMHDRYLPEKAIEILEETAINTYQKKGKDTVVSSEDIAEIISEKTDIPLTQITQTETDKLLHLEEEIHKRIVGQDEAVRMVSTAIRRSRAQLRDQKRPIVNLLFLGPTGVGKTELAKTIIKVYFGSDKEMIRLDMSEYQEKSSISRLLGSNDGSGSENGGYLTESVRKNPFCLVLLDEAEKAHPDILNVFLQVMDDGRLTDNAGRTIDFTNVVLIMTSNAGTPLIQKMVSQGKNVEEIKNFLLDGELSQYFRPEFLNRFDGIIVFRPLTMEDVEKIAILMLDEIKLNLEEKGMSLEVTEGALDELAEAGYDPKFGARPLRRVLQERITDTLANYILTGQLKRRDKLIFDVGGRVDIIKAKEL